MSGGGQGAEILYLILLLVLVGSGLVARRLPLGHSLKMAGAWVAIFAAAFLLFQLRDDIKGVWQRVTDRHAAETTGLQVGEELRIAQGSDGHFWVDADVNGRSVRFLIDSGATVTSLSADAARAAGVDYGGGFPVAVNTANGTVMAERGRVGRFRVGHIVREDLPVFVSGTFGDTNVIGMNFLSSLSGWRVEGRTLILRP